MKRYLTFIFNKFEPDGGMRDFAGDCDDLQEAINFIECKVDEEKYHKTIEYQWEFTWAHIYDTEKMEIVWSKEG